MYSVIVLSKPMLDNGGEFSFPDLNEQKSNDSIGSDHLTSGKLIRHVMRYIKKSQTQSNFKTLSQKINHVFKTISRDENAKAMRPMMTMATTALMRQLRLEVIPMIS